MKKWKKYFETNYPGTDVTSFSNFYAVESKVKHRMRSKVPSGLNQLLAVWEKLGMYDQHFQSSLLLIPPSRVGDRAPHPYSLKPGSKQSLFMLTCVMWMTSHAKGLAARSGPTRWKKMPLKLAQQQLLREQTRTTSEGDGMHVVQRLQIKHGVFSQAAQTRKQHPSALAVALALVVSGVAATRKWMTKTEKMRLMTTVTAKVTLTTKVLLEGMLRRPQAMAVEAEERKRWSRLDW